MKPSRRVDLLFLWCPVLVTLGFLFGPTRASSGEVQFESGDVIFQTSSSKQSYAIMWASKTLFSHVGIVEVSGKKTYVLEAINVVSRTPIEKWIARGRLGRYAVYRHPGLSEDQKSKVIKSAKAMLGKKYDIYFTSLNDEIYCSELVAKAYDAAGIDLGKIERVKDLDFDNVLVRKLVGKRWKGHPACKKAKTFDQCWKVVLEDTLVTPVSLSGDPSLEKIHSSYPL